MARLRLVATFAASIAVASIAYASIDQPDESTSLEERMSWLEDALHRKVGYLANRINELFDEVETIKSSPPSEIPVACGPILPGDRRAGLVAPEYQSPDAFQRAHDAGASVVVNATAEGEQCDPLRITRDNFWVVGLRWEVGGGGTLSTISVTGADNVWLGDMFRMGLEEISLRSSSVHMNDVGVSSATVVDSRLSFSHGGGIGNGTFIDSYFLVHSGVRGALFGETEVVNSYIEIEEGGFEGRLLVRGASYVNFGPGASVSGEIVCDPQTSRVYDPQGVVGSISFEPSQVSTETCLIQAPYQ